MNGQRSAVRGRKSAIRLSTAHVIPAVSTAQRRRAFPSAVTLPPGDKYFTRIELAGILKVSLRTVDALIANRAIPFLRLGSLIRFRLEDVERYLAERFLVQPAPNEQEGA